MDFRLASFWRSVMFSALLNFLVQAVHEAGHWPVYQAYGHGPVWGFTSLVQIWDVLAMLPVVITRKYFTRE